ncbi:MAG: mechanosensitive ion channel family protein [Bacteroidales bacterium]|nr:mechanosensitive ion channel family protein [Bacteroidales bacterium]
MKKILVLLLLSLVTVFQAHAVLKEKDLSQTLGVLRAELEQAYKEQKVSMARFEKRNMDQHANLIKMMQKSNQVALMLYSQNSDFTFDMAYACQEATEQYRTIKMHHMPYDKMKERLHAEIDRYDGLIKALQDLPPRLKPNGELAKMPDSIRALLPKMVMDTAKLSLFILDKQGLADREACLDYATALRDNYVKLLENVEKDQEHYERVIRRVGELNKYAMSRYEKIQNSIFVNAGSNYFKTLQRFGMYYSQAKKDVDDRYRPLKKYSEWRGPVIVGISIFMLFYIAIASLLSYAIIRWFLPKHWREKIVSPRKQPYFMVALGVAIFAISIMIARGFVKQNFILMAIDLMIMFAWLLEVILVSLLIRLDDKQIRAGVRAYFPFLTMAFLVIVFRIILIPNNLVNLIYPPILLAFTIWQIVVLKRKLERLPDSDMIYTVISLIAMLVACVAAWIGFVLLAVQIMIWWTIQLAAIQTITCCYDIAKWYEYHHLLRKIADAKGMDVNKKEDFNKLYKKMQPKMAKGEYITYTWFYDFLYKALLPVMAVLSVLVSIYWAASIFEMTTICKKIFMYVFLDKPGLIQLSLYKMCLVIALYFVFRYLNYALRAFFQTFRKRRMKDTQGPSNITLANNIISILVWGTFAAASLIILQVPSSGISIVMAGLATGLGFAMKDLLENFVYGISLMTGRLRVGDYIECDGIQGKVESINYQSTQIVTLDGCVIAFQNTTLFSKNFKNLTRNHGYVLVKVPVGVAYGVNVDRVRDMLIKALQPLLVKNAAGKYIVDPKQKVSVAFSDFGDSSVNLFVVCWVLVEEKISFVAKVNEVIYNTLNKNHIEIPFPQQDVYVRHIEMPVSETPTETVGAEVKKRKHRHKSSASNEQIETE